MKNHPRFLLVALSAALLSLPSLSAADAPAGGPPDGPRGERREKMGERMAGELGLSADQQAQMKQLNQQEKAELEALRENTALAKEDKRAQLDAIRKSYMEKRQAIMTPEQREKARHMREKMGKRMEERRGEGRPERRGEDRPGRREKSGQPK
jgi:Spy/CpxP family protein refolding chaperone